MTKDNSKNLAISNLGSIALDFGEMAIDSLLSEGAVRDIPILGSLVGLFQSGVNIKEHIFQKKIESLINNIGSVSEEELESFNLKFESNPDLAVRVAEHLTLIIDRLDDLEKTKYIGRAFTSLLKEDINFEQFRRIARAIERCMIEDLNEVHNFERANDAFSEISYELAASGLIQLVQLPQVATSEVKGLYKITEFGSLFVRIILAGK